MTSADRPILVTGGAGFIGSHVVDRLLADGRPVVVVDNLSTGSAANLPSAAACEAFDLAAEAAAERIAGLRPRAIIHCAAQTSVSASVREPVADARANILGSLNAITGALAGGCDRFVYVTTGGAIYGEEAGRPHSEADVAAPKSPYGLSKWTVEEYLRILAGDRLAWSALRLANVYGPRQRSDGEGGVVSIFGERMLHDEPVHIHGDGQQTRDFVFVADVVEAIVLALDAGGGPVNIGTGQATTVNELFTTMAALAGYRRPPVHGEPRPGDLVHSRLDPSRAAAVLGWRPAVDLESGLRRTLASIAAAPGR